MQYEISNRMSVCTARPSASCSSSARTNMISFGGGNPSAETFPVPEIADIIAETS